MRNRKKSGDAKILALILAAPLMLIYTLYLICRTGGLARAIFVCGLALTACCCIIVGDFNLAYAIPAILTSLLALATHIATKRKRARAQSIAQTGEQYDTRSNIPRRRDFIALDFETANSRYYSACALGIVRFFDGAPVDRGYYLINPDTPFDAANIAIHGITPDDVATSPKFPDVWNEIMPHLMHQTIVAYSDFDRKVLVSLLRRYSLGSITALEHEYIDVCAAAREQIIGLANYKLPTVAEYLDIDGLEHHNALSDAETAGRIYVELTKHNRPIIASESTPATYPQQDFIRQLGGTVPPVLSKSDASAMIENLLQYHEAKRQARANQRDSDHS